MVPGEVFEQIACVDSTENPGWLVNKATGETNFSSVELQEILEEHVTQVVQHYGRRAYCWDVVNEAIYDGENVSQFLKPSAPWYPAVPGYIDAAFIAARKADPHVKLFYNEYSAEGLNAKSGEHLLNRQSLAGLQSLTVSFGHPAE